MNALFLYPACTCTSSLQQTTRTPTPAPQDIESENLRSMEAAGRNTRNGTRKKYCAKCQIHDLMRELKGHKNKCDYSWCKCKNCCKVEFKRYITRRNVKQRRDEALERELLARREQESSGMDGESPVESCNPPEAPTLAICDTPQEVAEIRPIRPQKEEKEKKEEKVVSVESVRSEVLPPPLGHHYQWGVPRYSPLEPRAKELAEGGIYGLPPVHYPFAFHFHHLQACLYSYSHPSTSYAIPGPEVVPTYIPREYNDVPWDARLKMGNLKPLRPTPIAYDEFHKFENKETNHFENVISNLNHLEM